MACLFTKHLTIKNLIFIIHEFIIRANAQHVHQHFCDWDKKIESATKVKSLSNEPWRKLTPPK